MQHVIFQVWRSRNKRKDLGNIFGLLGFIPHHTDCSIHSSFKYLTSLPGKRVEFVHLKFLATLLTILLFCYQLCHTTSVYDYLLLKKNSKWLFGVDNLYCFFGGGYVLGCLFGKENAWPKEAAVQVKCTIIVAVELISCLPI